MKFDKLLIALLLLSLIIRVFPLGFPSFTSDEARIAVRGHVLSTLGKDELGNSFPLFFNSSADYQFPVVPYLTAVGELVFGNNDFGARIPFILIGTILVFLSYKIAESFNSDQWFKLGSAFIVATSPVLIFLSKTPNEIIVLTSFFALLYLLLIKQKKFWMIGSVMFLTILTSKLALFFLIPFTWLTVYKQNKKLVILSVIIVVLGLLLFFTNEQAKRSFMENNFSLLSDVTVKNGIDKLRGEGLKAGWPSFVNFILFNKSHYLIIGFLHWVSYFSPALYVGQFDSSGLVNYFFLGVWAKILIIPFIIGLIQLIRKQTNLRFLLGYTLIFTFPALFNYPKFDPVLIVLSIPFIALVITFGLLKLNKLFAIFVLCLVILELSVNIYSLTPQYKNALNLRPNWVKSLVLSIDQTSKSENTYVSDDIVSDIGPFMEWYTNFNPKDGFEQVKSPYKFTQYKIGKVKLLGAGQIFTTCGKEQKLIIYASPRDLKKIKNDFKPIVDGTFSDSNGQIRLYRINNTCIR